MRLIEYRDQWHGKTAVWLEEKMDGDVWRVDYLPNFPVWVASAIVAGLLLAWLVS